MPDSPFIGPTYPLTSRGASVARTVNMIPVPNEVGNDRAGWTMKDVGGLVLVTTYTDGSSEAGDFPGYSAVPGGSPGTGRAGEVCFLERFVDAALVPPYAVISGSAGDFTRPSSPYGTGLLIAPTLPSTQSKVQRSITSTVVKAASFKFTMSAFSTGDSESATVTIGSHIIFCARAATYFDATRRPFIVVDGEVTFLSASALSATTWYRLDITIGLGVGTSTVALYNITTNVLVATTTLAAAHVAIAATTLSFATGAPPAYTSVTQYDYTGGSIPVGWKNTMQDACSFEAANAYSNCYGIVQLYAGNPTSCVVYNVGNVQVGNSAVNTRSLTSTDFTGAAEFADLRICT